jgi:hypothetical protein
MNEYELFDEVIENILIAAENIDSEQEYFEVLSALFSRSTKNPENINYFFDSFDNLLEDYTISMCLMALLNEDYNYSNENVESICMLARKLGSSHEYSYIIFQLVNTIKLDEENSFTILEACQPIVSEGELVNLLVAIGLKMPKDNPELIKAYQRVAGNLQSVADFNKALKVIEK